MAFKSMEDAKAYKHKWYRIDYLKRREAILEKGREKEKQLRIDALMAYSSGKQPGCVCCGETTYHFLTIDHIEGKGNIHRREDPQAGKIARWLKKHNYPDGFQVLCYNCNISKGKYGFCPHG